MIKQFVFSLLLLALFIGLVGCSSGRAWGLGAPGLTKEEVNRRHVEAIDTDRLQLQDDIDEFFMFNRPGRRNRLSVR